MKYNLAIDSGGTKVVAILYDEHFHPIAASRVGSIRPSTTLPHQIQLNMEKLVRELDLASRQVIHRVTGIVPEEFLAYLKETCQVLNVDALDELSAGLCAAEIFGDGIQTLSGTGSNSAVRYQGNTYFVGGYGPVISDIGSGFWIGREALNAAIADFEGYGPHTSLTDLLSSHFGGNRDQFHEAIFSIYENDMVSVSAQVADCSRIVSFAAETGDQTAISILRKAGKLLATQTISMLEKHRIPESVPQTISGSVWRGHPAFLSSFLENMLAHNKAYTIKLPEFEPIVGVIIKHYYDINGHFSTEGREYLRALYSQYALYFPAIAETLYT